MAREFTRLGCEVPAIVGTREASVAEALRGLEPFGIEARGYTSLATLLETEAVDVVAICSPAEVHLAQLEEAIAAGCHVFCEKPLWWADDLTRDPDQVAARAERLLARLTERGLHLALNTQWPFTLEAFRALHPAALESPLERFEMWMAPDKTGPRMMIDSASHLMSMLQALAGPGSMERPQVTFHDPERSHLTLSASYRHAKGLAAVEFRLKRCSTIPRPAGYAVNGNAVERHIELPSYQISFAAHGERIPMRDPLAASVEAFLGAARADTPPDRTHVVDGMTQLVTLVASAEAAAERTDVC